MRNVLLIVLISAAASLVNVTVGSSGFRISLGIVVMAAGLIALKLKPVLLTSLLTGVAVCLLRIAVTSAVDGMTPALAGNYLLEVFFYVGYGLIYWLTVVRSRAVYKTPLVISLVIADVGANALEYFLRFVLADAVWQNTSLTAILLAAFVRSVLIVLVVWLLETYVLKAARQAPADRG